MSNWNSELKLYANKQKFNGITDNMGQILGSRYGVTGHSYWRPSPSAKHIGAWWDWPLPGGLTNYCPSVLDTVG